MFGNFEEEARKVLVNAKKEMFDLKHPYVSSEHLLLAILKSENEVSEKLKGYDLDYNKFRSEIVKIIGMGSKASEWFLYTPLLKRILENATYDAKENNNGTVTINHLFVSLLDEGEGVADLMADGAYFHPVRFQKVCQEFLFPGSFLHDLL